MVYDMKICAAENNAMINPLDLTTIALALFASAPTFVITFFAFFADRAEIPLWLFVISTIIVPPLTVILKTLTDACLIYVKKRYFNGEE